MPVATCPTCFVRVKYPRELAGPLMCPRCENPIDTRPDAQTDAVIASWVADSPPRRTAPAAEPEPVYYAPVYAEPKRSLWPVLLLGLVLAGHVALFFVGRHFLEKPRPTIHKMVDSR